MTQSLDRDALYHPYIHIHDVEWLKATLLCFPQVRRILPGNFIAKDSSVVAEFKTIKGARGEPLLTDEYADIYSGESPVHLAQERLLRALYENEDLVLQKYAIPEHPQELEWTLFKVHTGKVMYELAQYLCKNRLAVPAPKPGDYFAEELGDWIGVHRVLAEAIMSFIAIAIARDKGLDIVTSEGNIHHALAALSEGEVMKQLVGRPELEKETPVQEKIDELAEVVMTFCFNLEKLTPTQIGDLVRDGKDLRQFKTALVPFAETIPDIANPEERRKRLIQGAALIINEWTKYKKSLPRFAIDALVDSYEIKFPELAAGVMMGGAGWHLASGAGLAIGLLTWKGLGIWRKFKERTSNPYNYLSRIEKKGAALVVGPSV